MSYPPYDPPADAETSEADEAYVRHRTSRQLLPELDLDPHEQQQWARQTLRARMMQAAVAFWLCASPFVVVPLVLRHEPWWIATFAAGVVGIIVGYLLPTNVPPPRHAPSVGGAYGIYDPRGPHGPRS